ncbi:MAG: hypothetical protein IPG96_07075 [Proteobacteria bacterium]|nr:hypothetical protein [Pseudomonadota bacterium]
MIVATALNTELSYAFCFVAFTVAATWSLVLLQLRRELEQQAQAAASSGGATAPAPPAGPAAPEPTALATRQLIGLRFVAGTSLLSLGMLAGALAVFVSFPRIGFGLFSGAPWAKDRSPPPRRGREHGRATGRRSAIPLARPLGEMARSGRPTGE